MKQKKGSELFECEELLLTWFPLSAPSPILFFVALYSSSRAVHRSLMYLVRGVGFSWSRLIRSTQGRAGESDGWEVSKSAEDESISEQQRGKRTTARRLGLALSMVALRSREKSRREISEVQK